MGGWCLPRSLRWSLRSEFVSFARALLGIAHMACRKLWLQRLFSRALNRSLQREGWYGLSSGKLQFRCRHKRNPQVVFVTCKACDGSARSIENTQLGMVLTQECLHIRDLMSALEKWKRRLLIDRGPASPAQCHFSFLFPSHSSPLFLH